ncbi:hypothetical protein CFN78_02520 [Amycolatopsis antarctica]|uniref:ESX-1 secretion-associated protein n=1 Tax=Amycolatopsis antarctica TaxID=1854586 RepID=A0A263DA68_9PSEU|nr:type VII secretion target [Amycolatopsis antarctica]OZM75069.1 hypothetical protein CFN78_02520 [Amycolatopsis antarctica]
MSGGFEVDAERLGDKASEFGGLAERAERITAALRTALAGSGAPWGDDTVGRSFAAVHEGPAAETAGRCAGLGAGLDGLGDALTAAAARYADGDSAAARRLGPDAGS